MKELQYIYTCNLGEISTWMLEMDTGKQTEQEGMCDKPAATKVCSNSKAKPTTLLRVPVYWNRSSHKFLLLLHLHIINSIFNHDNLCDKIIPMRGHHQRREMIMMGQFLTVSCRRLIARVMTQRFKWRQIGPSSFSHRYLCLKITILQMLESC